MLTNTVAISLTLAGLIGAQVQEITIPSAAVDTECPASSLWTPGGARHMAVYANSEFAGVGAPITIQRIRIRADATHPSSSPPIVTAFRIHMATASRSHAALSSHYEDNMGSDRIDTAFRFIIETATSGGSPNGHVFDLPLQQPFTYDPRDGADLVIDIEMFGHRAPTSVALDACPTGGASVVAGRHTAPNGTVTNTVPVLTLDYVVGGYARTTIIGFGCGNGTGRTMYELFDPDGSSQTPANPFDLSAGWVAIPEAHGYFCAAAGGHVAPPTSAPLSFTSGPVAVFPLPWTFPFPGGTTSSIHVSRDGWLSLEAQASTEAAYPSLEGLLDGPRRICPLWQRYADGAGASVHAEFDPANPDRVRVTWIGMRTPRSGPNTFQLTLFSSGIVATSYAATDVEYGLVGMGPGNGAHTPPQTDLSVALPSTGWWAGTETGPLGLLPDGDARPIMGTQFPLRITAYPQSTTAGVIAFSLSQQTPPLTLGPLLGPPGCKLFLGPTVARLPLPPTTSDTILVRLGIPTDNAFAGLEVFAQATIARDSRDPLPIALSNGLRLQFYDL